MLTDMTGEACGDSSFSQKFFLIGYLKLDLSVIGCLEQGLPVIGCEGLMP